MNRLLLPCLLLVAWLPARADTNLAPAISLLLDEKTALELTAGLEQYRNPPQFSGKLTSVGGGSTAILVNRWAAGFNTIYPGVELDCHGGGVADGLSGLLEGRVDLVPMSRALNPDEIKRFKDRFGYEPAQIVVARDAEAVYVNKNNPIAGLSLAQLDAIYSRDAKRAGGRPEFWHDLGVTGPVAEQRILRVSLNRAHSNYAYFQEHVLQGGEYHFAVHFDPVPGSMVQDVGADDGAIGFASVMFATARTRFVPLRAADGGYALPSYEDTVSGRYPLVRPMRIVFNRKPGAPLNPAVREFLRFAVSRHGQRIIALAGSYPISIEQQREAMAAIGEVPSE